MYWECFIPIIGGQKVDKKQIIDTMWDDSPVDVSTEVNLIGQLQINYVVHTRVINIRM